MSLGVHCVVCDTRIDPYGRDGATCARCQQPCATCGGDVQHCQHPLRSADILTLEPKHVGGGRWQVAA